MSTGPLPPVPGPLSNQALTGMHTLFLEALRHREQEILQYLAILGPALGGFIWILQEEKVDEFVFLVGTFGVLFLLFIGALYALALGYNYRYIVLQLAKLEAALGITSVILSGWPRTPEDFRTRYRLGSLPWCTPPEIIKSFWLAFVVGLIGVTLAASLSLKRSSHCVSIRIVGALCVLVALLTPIVFGRKLQNRIKEEATW